MEELEGLAEQQRVKPQAAARAGSKGHIERDTHQAGTNARTCKVLDESIGHGFKDTRAARAPQHGGVTCGEEEKASEKGITYSL